MYNEKDQRDDYSVYRKSKVCRSHKVYTSIPIRISTLKAKVKTTQKNCPIFSFFLFVIVSDRVHDQYNRYNRKSDFVRRTGNTREVQSKKDEQRAFFT